MAKPHFHALSSAKKYGGVWEDYIEIHTLIDSSKAAFPDNRHRALTHNAWFIGYILPRIFGETYKRASDGKIVNTRDIGEQHVLEDYKMKFIPTVSDFLSEMEFVSWMMNGEGTPPVSHKKIAKAIKERKPKQLTIFEKVEDIIKKAIDVPEPVKRREPTLRPSSFIVDGKRGGSRYNNDTHRTFD